MNEILKGQSAMAASAQENEIISENTIEDALLKSMTWFVGGKGVEVHLYNSNTKSIVPNQKYWVEKSMTDNGLVYKFVQLNNGKTHSMEVNPSTWSDCDLFSGNMLRTIAGVFANNIYTDYKNEKEA